MVTVSSRFVPLFGDNSNECTATGVCSASYLSGDDGSSSSSSSSSSSGSSSSSSGSGGISKAVAGVIGAMVTLAVILLIEGAIILLGGFRLVSKKRLAGNSPSVSSVDGGQPKA